MKSRLISAFTASALVLALAGVANAAPGLVCTPASCKTDVSVTVTEGTTITAPASVSVGSAFPGQTATSASQAVSWWSNEQGLQLTVAMDGDLVNDQSTVSVLDDTTIDADNVQLSSTDYPAWVAIDTARPVADIADVTAATLEAASTSNFTLRVNVPSATEGLYGANMTWTVQ